MVKLISMKELISRAIESEQISRKVYLGFVHKFRDRHDVAEFWQAMADDEKEHAWILSELLYRVNEHDRHAPVDARLAEKADTIKRLDAQQLIHSVHNLDEACRVAYDLESSEINTIFNLLTIRFLPHDESGDIISATIDRHLLRLAKFSRSIGDIEACRRIQATG